MQNDIKIHELWSLRINPSDLYNIERPIGDNPSSGGGHTYIQVPKSQVKPLLSFLHEKYPQNGVPIILTVHNQGKPGSIPEQIEFWAKSAGRMRISKQNRHRHSRLSAWSPANGFPVLKPNETTDDARKLLKSIGELHIYIARGEDDSVWAGYTKGAPSNEQLELPFASILWGTSPGSYWIYKEDQS